MTEESRAARKMSRDRIYSSEFDKIERALKLRALDGVLDLAADAKFGGFGNTSARYVFGPAWLIDVFNNALTHQNMWLEGTTDLAHFVCVGLDLIPPEQLAALEALTRLTDVGASE